MPGPDRRQQALELAKVRWAQNHNCDLHPDTWQQLFETYQPGVILEAIKRTKQMSDPRPEVHYARLCIMLERLTPIQ